MATKPTTPKPKPSNGKMYWVSEWRDDRGKKRSKGFGAADRVSEAEAYRLYTSWLAESWYTNPEVQTPTAILSLHELCSRYLSWAAVYYRDSDGNQTQEPTKIFYTLNPLSEKFGNSFADELRPRHIKQYRDKLIKAGLARSTINMRVDIIKRMYRWAAENELVTNSAMYEVLSVKALAKNRSDAVETSKVTGVAWDIWQKTIKHMPPTLATMVQVQFYGAMRPQDICQMCAVDITTKGDVWIYEPGKHLDPNAGKHKLAYQGRTRKVYLGPHCQELLKPFLGRDLLNPMFMPQEAQDQRNDARRAAYTPPDEAAGDYRTWKSASSRRRGNARYRPCYTVHAYRTAIKDVCKAHNIPHWTPNQLRHAAKDFYEDKYGVEVASKMLGHAKLETTQVYGEKQMREAMEAARKLG